MSLGPYNFERGVPLSVIFAINQIAAASGGGGGTVTSFAFTNANGVSGVISNPTTTPNLTLTLGAITPSSIAATGTITGSNLSGINTGDQTNISGNAATATFATSAGVLSPGRAINGVAFDGSTNITVTAAAGTLTGATLASNVLASSLTSVGTLAALTVTATITGSVSGNAATVTTNANLTGPVTSVGNATTIAANVVTEAMQNISDVTTKNVSTSAHGYAPKITDTTKFLKGDGTWATPTATAADIATSMLAPSTDESIAASLSAVLVRSYAVASGKKLSLASGARFRIL